MITISNHGIRDKNKKNTMGKFSEEGSKNESNSKVKVSDENVQIIDRPRICCIDLNEESISTLRNSGCNIYSGSLGSKIKVPNYRNKGGLKLLLNYNFPADCADLRRKY